MRPLLAVSRKELRQMLRDKRTLLVILFIPIFFLWLYGYALNFDIRDVPLIVKDDDRSTESREIVKAFVTSGYFELVDGVQDDAQVRYALDHGTARAALVLPGGLAERLRSGRRVAIQVLVNGDNANTASTVMGYAAAIVRATSARLVPSGAVAAALAAEDSSGVGGGAGQPTGPAIVLEPRVWFNPQLESTLFLVPGLIAYIAMITAVVSTSLSVAREKERGTMEQVRMSPVSTLTFVVGKSIPYFVLSFISSMAIFLAGMALFGVPMRGEWWLLLLSTTLFLMAALGMGLFISTVSESQQVAFQLALIVSFLPTFILSGFIFPIASMPAPIQRVSHLVPARYYLVALRSVALKGVGFDVVAPQLGALALFSVIVVGLAAYRLSREQS